MIVVKLQDVNSSNDQGGGNTHACECIDNVDELMQPSYVRVDDRKLYYKSNSDRKYFPNISCLFVEDKLSSKKNKKKKNKPKKKPNGCLHSVYYERIVVI